MNKQDILNTVEKLYNTYESNEFILTKLHENINKLEKKLLDQQEQYESRIELKNKMNIEKELFIHDFLSNYKFYYIQDSNIFIEYDNEHYRQINENNIWSKVYTEIHKFPNLKQWKHKIRVEILSLIKKNTVHNVQLIPNTKTIQIALQIIKSILVPSKELSKYVLTLLGDSILKKTNTNTTIIPTTNIDSFLDSIEFQIHYYMRCYFKDIFKQRYHNHDYENIRVLQTNECSNTSFIWSSTLKKYIFDIVFVACHYSKRYKNADNYVEKFCDSKIYNTIFFCKNNTKNDILNKFIDTEFDKDKSLCVFQRDLKYLINNYFDNIGIPKTLFYSDVNDYFDNHFKKDIINEKGKDEIVYKGISSKQSNFIQTFMSFFDDTFIINNEPTDNITNFELSEIVFIYNKSITSKNYSLNEKLLLSILNQYYPQINIIDDNLVNISCNIWNKNNDINEFIKYFNKEFDDDYKSILDDNDKLYEYYFKWCEDTNKIFVVSKHYFEENI